MFCNKYEIEYYTKCDMENHDMIWASSKSIFESVNYNKSSFIPSPIQQVDMIKIENICSQFNHIYYPKKFIIGYKCLKCNYQTFKKLDTQQMKIHLNKCKGKSDSKIHDFKSEQILLNDEWLYECNHCIYNSKELSKIKEHVLSCMYLQKKLSKFDTKIVDNNEHILIENFDINSNTSFKRSSEEDLRKENKKKKLY